MRAKRLVLVLQDLLFGGTQRHALELARRIDRARFSPEFWMLSRGADFAPQARDADIPMTWLGTRRDVGAGAVLALRRALRGERPDILMPLTAVPNIWARVWGRLAGVPALVGTCRGGGAIARQHERFLARLAHHHIVNTDALRQSLLDLGRPPEKISVIRNGVDTDLFSPDPDGIGPMRPVVLCVARLVEDKDHPTLLAAFDALRARVPDAELWLVGEGPLKARVELSIRRMAHGEGVKIFPGGADLRPFYRQAMVLALSSVREGLPNVVLEGMASGLPVVATAVGGIPEVVEQGRTGYTSPAGDATALARNLERVLRDQQERERLSAQARATALERYSMQAMVARHEDVLDRVSHAALGRN